MLRVCPFSGPFPRGKGCVHSRAQPRRNPGVNFGTRATNCRELALLNLHTIGTCDISANQLGRVLRYGTEMVEYPA